MDEKDEDFQNLPENKIPRLKEEIGRNDEILMKNKENYRQQVQAGLFDKGLSQSSPMYDTLIIKMEYDIEVEQIKLDSGFKCINPVYEFQGDGRIAEINVNMSKKHIKALKDNLKEIKQNLGEVKNDITKQAEFIKNRRVQILEELGKLGEDVSELKKKAPDYIN